MDILWIKEDILNSSLGPGYLEDDGEYLELFTVWIS